MEIQINGKKQPVEDGQTLDELVDKLGLQGKRGIAVALNATVIPRQRWASQPLKPGDDVEIIHAVQGG